MEAIKSIYHPDNVDAETFIAGFTIRRKEFADIIDTIKKQKAKPLQHFLILGKRGMGKSTLLRRIFLEADKPPVSNKLVAVRLGTEQYRLSRLYKLWEEVIHHLSFKDSSLDEKRRVMSEEKHYEEGIIHIILDYLKEQNETLLLLIDNFDKVIDKLTLKEQHTLREILIQYPVQIIGTTVFYDEHFFQYDKPFYDFFKPVRLKNLDKEEADQFINSLAVREGIPRFEETFTTQRGKIQTLRILSGGVPRTLVILVNILSKRSTGNAVDYLREVLEGVTTLYQSRMNSLSSQQQEIMHHLAIRWDRTPVKDLAKDMRLPSKSISAQLAQLETSGYINKIATNNRNLYYEIDERFFNIWLLMSEAAPYDAKRVVWLTRWLDMFYNKKELEDYASWCNTNLKTAKPANRFLIAQALSESQKLSYKFKDQIVNDIAKDLSNTLPQAKDWEADYGQKKRSKAIELTKKITELISKQKYEEAIKKLNTVKELDETNANSGLGYIYLIQKDYIKAEEYYLIAAEQGDTDAMNNLGYIYSQVKKDYTNAENYYLNAAIKGNSNAMDNLGLYYYKIKNDYNNAEKYFLMAANNENTNAMFNLGYLYDTMKKDYDNAEKYYHLSAEKGNTDAMHNLGILYSDIKKEYDKSEKYYRMAAEKGNIDAMVNLGLFYYRIKEDYHNAEKYFLQAAEKNNRHSMNNLAYIYFEKNITTKKEAALSIISGIKDVESNPLFIATKIEIFLWNEHFKEAYLLIQTLIDKYLENEDSAGTISGMLTYFIVFKQKQFLYRMFIQENSSLIDRFKPVYFALLSEMKEEFPNEYLRMPEELEEPVNDVLSSVKDERERLGI